MKNLVNYILAILSVAVIYLLYRDFRGFGTVKEESVSLKNEKGDTLKKGINPIPLSGKYAFIDLDSISLKYNFINDQAKSLKSRYDGLNSQYENMVLSFQEEYKRFQESVNAGIAPQAQLEQKQAELQRKNNEIVQKENQIKNLEMEMEKVKSETMNKVNEYIARYNDKYNYDFIFSRTSLVNTMAFANPALDITNEIIKGLNDEYVSKK
jgi:outer membrane protein